MEIALSSKNQSVVNRFATTKWSEKNTKNEDILSSLKDKVIKNLDISEELKFLNTKEVGLGVLGAIVGSALAYLTFNIALIPVSFLLQTLFSGGIVANLSPQLEQLLQTILGLGVVGAQYSSLATGAVAGFKTTSDLTTKSNPTKIEDLKIALEKFKNSESLWEYIRNGFNLGVQWGKETNTKAGKWANIPLATAASVAMMAPLALLVASLATPLVGLGPAIIAGLLSSLPLGIKVFNAVRNFAKDVYGIIGGAIGGALGAVIGSVSKIFKGIKGLFSHKTEDSQLDEFQKNSPYKNSGIEEIMDSTGKITENFIKGSADVLSFTGLINNILTKNTTGLGTIASIVGGTIKSFEGASILKNAAVDNKPENFKVGLFRFLSGFSMLLSFLGSFIGPWGIVGFSIASLGFMALEKVFLLKNKIIKNENKEGQNTLKNSYAVGAAGGQFVESVGNLGKFWMNWDTIFGGNYGGLTSIFGLVGSTKDILQGAKMMQMSKERDNLGIGVQGLINIVGGISLALAALGLGRIFGFISLGVEIAKIVLQLYSLAK